MKNFKKKLIVFLFFALNILSANADFLWDINSGLELFYNKQYSTAVDFFNSYINNKPDNYDGYYWLAKSYKELNLNEFAKENFKKSFEIAIKDGNLEKNLLDNEQNAQTIEDYFDMAVMYFENSNYKEAMRYADLMLALNKKLPSAYFIKAKILYVLGDIEGAKANLNNAILYDSNILKTNLAAVLRIFEVPEASKDFYYNFAYEKYFEGDLDTSLSYVRKYLELEPDNQDMLNFLVDLYIKKNDINNAKSITQEVFKKYPNNINNLLLSAKIYKYENKTPQMKEILDKAYQINPNKEETLYMLAEYYYDSENYEKSSEIFKNIIEINDKNISAYYFYVSSLINLNKVNDALLAIRKLNNLNAKNSTVDFLTSQVCLLEGEFENANEYLNSALKKDKNKIYYFEKAKVSYILGDYIQSIKELDEIKNVNYEKIAENEVKRAYFKNYIKLNDVENAKNYINSYNSIDKNSIMYKYDLYELYKIQGDIEKQNELKTQLKKAKPSTLKDSIILSDFKQEISLTKEEENAVNKFLDDTAKKFGNNFEIILQKNKLKKAKKYPD